jgi:hypothetical protein
MKLLLVLGFLGVAALAFGADEKRPGSSPDLHAQPGSAGFGLAQAQALADVQRIAKYGVCGMSVFKEKQGAIWLFATKVGYAGIAAPDIAVIEPPGSPPGFGKAQNKTDRIPEPTPGGGAQR